MANKMREKRIIACLDILDGEAVKGVNFVNLRSVGNVVELASLYEQEGCDELAMLNIAATKENHKPFIELLKKVREAIDIPIVVGGGINSTSDALSFIESGATKISVNSAAVKNPPLLDELSKEFGSENLICAIDVCSNEIMASAYEVFIGGGKIGTKKDALKWALEAQGRGCGEILLTSMDRDGTKNGFDVILTHLFSSKLDVPVIASGGAGKMEHFLEVFEKGSADAALAASIFHFREVEIAKLKLYLAENGIAIRQKR
jgi:cyclase